MLAYVMKTLNERYGYGLELFLLSIDEGITGYRDDSLEVGFCCDFLVVCLWMMVGQTVKRNQEQYDMPLKILSYDELYGWTMDDIVSQVGRKNNCTFCGVFRRQALDRGAAMLGVDHIVTGHNADDIAETVLMNSELLGLFRGDSGADWNGSYEGGHCEVGTVHDNLYTGRGYNQTVEAVQVCL